ncbi:ABC transporter domain-containing protein [Dolosigranulum pigrum]|uniref:ABC transporter domain-containing protein n=1 Tax=Dolosigranulum pigrum ATCC 51524 TaxID=883103 RepID=H3NED7_9LACT|nr:hypothetical protein HMPREF9703_00918 [Dolosigranulum pigrum ATCC 51524]
MKMILSLIEPTTGKILVNGRDVKKNKDYLSQVGSMIEEPSYYPNLTGYENLLVFQKMIGFSEGNIWPTLELVGLTEEKNRKKLVRDYSLGMKQRLALAFALVKEPKILLLDEPTNGLDPSGIHEIRELIVRLAKVKGLTVFISSHILTEIEHIADRVGIINKGHLVYEGKIESIKSSNWIEIGGNFYQNNIVQSLLDFGGLEILEVSRNQIKLKNIDDEKLADVVSYLATNGYRIFRVVRASESLEEIFLSLTKEA